MKITKLPGLNKIVSTINGTPTMVVYSHLRWEFVKQRPQHLMERLSKEFNILFIEEPIDHTEDIKMTARELQVNDQLTVIQPRIDWHNPAQLASITQHYLNKLSLDNPIAWFYSPAFVEVLDEMDYAAVVFDCMDELAAFKGASKELLDQEKRLLSVADVVFTGGKSLYESKKLHSPNVYCFPSSVDEKHFKKARSNSMAVPTDMKKVHEPVVGYYGVIDERIDLELLDKAAQALPHVSFVMVGPVVKIDSDTLPQHANIHYLGGKDYKELPSYLAHFDVAMMPFALNEATRFISPTKTLEFMAALKKIVSTPIKDVVRDYKKEVYIAKDSQEFINNIVKALFETDNQRKKREKLQQAVIDNTSWDKTAEAMQKLIKDALVERYQNELTVDQTQEVTQEGVELAYSVVSA